MIPILAEPRVKYEGLGFTSIKEKAMATKITFMKEIDVVELSYLLEEIEKINEDNDMLLLHPFCGGL